MLKQPHPIPTDLPTLPPSRSHETSLLILPLPNPFHSLLPLVIRSSFVGVPCTGLIPGRQAL